MVGFLKRIVYGVKVIWREFVRTVFRVDVDDSVSDAVKEGVGEVVDTMVNRVLPVVRHTVSSVVKFLSGQVSLGIISIVNALVALVEGRIPSTQQSPRLRSVV